MSLSPRFHSLRVAEKRQETADSVSLTFDIAEDLRPLYDFAAGQYLTLRTMLDGEELRRSYSICTGPDDGELRIAIKRVAGGAFSGWVSETLQPGDALDVMTPTGRFGVAHAPELRRLHVGFAAGSGITPILSIIRGILAREPLSRFALFYGNRSTADMLFRDALEQLKDRYLARFSVFHVLSREQQDVPVLNGRLDADKVALLLRHMIPVAGIDHAFICGPAEMSDAVEGALRDAGLGEERIHVERFVSSLGGRPRAAAAVPAADAAHRNATLIVDGKHADIAVAEGESVLDAALRAGLDLPYACKGGMCSTCRARLVSGEVRMDANYSLEAWETEAGFVLTCQAHPTTAHVVVDFDQV